MMKTSIDTTFTDKGLKKLFEKVNAAQKHGMKVGVLDADAKLAMIAHVHEYGAPEVGIPQRSFLRTTMRLMKRQYNTMLKSLLTRWTKGDLSLEQALFRFSTNVVSDVQKTLIRGVEPALQDATVKSKKRHGYSRPNTPLLATMRLYNSIKARIV